MERASSTNETVIRVRWSTHESSGNHVAFPDNDWGIEAAGKFQDYLLHQGAMQVTLAREKKNWA